jgi:hypothetical protein
MGAMKLLALLMFLLPALAAAEVRVVDSDTLEIDGVRPV